MALKKERPEQLLPDNYIARIEIVSRTLIIINLSGVIASTIVTVLGVWLFSRGGDMHGQSVIDVLGLMKVTTSNAGVALIALGIVGIILTIRRVLKSVDILLNK